MSLESLNKALAPLKDFTDILSAEGYVTVSTVKTVLHHLTTVVLMTLEEDTHLTKDISAQHNFRTLGTMMKHPGASLRYSRLKNDTYGLTSG